jgi:hypothetical protein
MELTNDQYVMIGRIAEEAVESEEKICGYKHMRKSGNGYGNIGKFICDRVPLLFVHDATLEAEFPEEIKHLRWQDDEYEEKDKLVDARLIEAFNIGRKGASK